MVAEKVDIRILNGSEAAATDIALWFMVGIVTDVFVLAQARMNLHQGFRRIITNAKASDQRLTGTLQSARKLASK